jgi:hypothetical protein
MILAKKASMWKMGFYPKSIFIKNIYPVFVKGSPIYQLVFDVLIDVLNHVYQDIFNEQFWGNAVDK